MVRRVLKDIKVPGTSSGTRAAEAPAQVQGLLQDSWERAMLSCVSSQVLVWTREACIGRNSQKEKENRGTQQLVRELSSAVVASCTPTLSVPGL